MIFMETKRKFTKSAYFKQFYYSIFEIVCTTVTLDKSNRVQNSAKQTSHFCKAVSNKIVLPNSVLADGELNQLQAIHFHINWV